MFDVNAIRRIFPHTKKTTYFNVASNGPLTTPAYMLQDKHYKIARMAAISDQSDMFAALDHIRRNAAKIFGCKKSEAGVGFNTTFGINLAAFGLPLKKGDEVILSDVEFPANVYPWLELRNRGIKVKFIKNTNGFFDLSHLEKAITRKTRVVSLSFVQYFNGYKADMEAIGELCRRRKIFLVLDAIQGAGAESMNLKKWNVSVASAGGQKWLLSSQGTGIFYVSEKTRQRLRPPWRSWLSIDWKCRWHDLRKFDLKYEKSAWQFELGTYPSPLVMSLDWTLDFITGLGIRNIQKHNHGLLDVLIEYLNSDSFYRITSSLEKKHRSSILSFTTDRADIAKVHQYLTAKKIVTSLREGSIRVSVHLYNNLKDIRLLIASLDAAKIRLQRKRK
jgi:selenocysteine lyase/cysteine desulfurase